MTSPRVGGKVGGMSGYGLPLEECSERAWKAVMHARWEATRRGDPHAGAGHLLVALSVIRGGHARGALRRRGVGPGPARRALARVAGRGGQGEDGARFIEGFSVAVEAASAVAGALGDPQFDTVHLLIGLLEDPEGDASRMLELMEVPPRRLRNEMFRLLLREGPTPKESVAYYRGRLLQHSASAGVRDLIERLVAERRRAYRSKDWETATLLSGLLVGLWSDLDFLPPARWRARALRKLRAVFPPSPADIPGCLPPEPGG